MLNGAQEYGNFQRLPHSALFKFTFLGMRMYINKWDETHLEPLMLPFLDKRANKVLVLNLYKY